MSGVQHDALNAELQRVRQVTLLWSPCAKGQGYSDRRYPGEQVRQKLNSAAVDLPRFRGWDGFIISSKLPVLPFSHQFIYDYLNHLKPFEPF